MTRIDSEEVRVLMTKLRKILGEVESLGLQLTVRHEGEDGHFHSISRIQDVTTAGAERERKEASPVKFREVKLINKSFLVTAPQYDITSIIGQQPGGEL